MPAPRKNPSALSTNPNTVKERNRRNAKTGFDATIEKAKHANANGFSYAKKKLIQSPSYLNAQNDDKRTAMIENLKAEVTAKQ